MALLLRYGARPPRKVAQLLRFSQANLSCPGWARWLQCERTGHAKSVSVQAQISHHVAPKVSALWGGDTKIHCLIPFNLVFRKRMVLGQKCMKR